MIHEEMMIFVVQYSIYNIVVKISHDKIKQRKNGKLSDNFPISLINIRNFVMSTEGQ